jgi:predicted CoA-binding protein
MHWKNYGRTKLNYLNLNSIWRFHLDDNDQNEALIQAILQSAKKIAVVGLSPKSNRPSYRVAQAMQQFSYQIVPVRPGVDYILGEQVYKSLQDIPFAVDLVNVFRAPEFIPAIVDDCIALNIPALWLQEGVIHEQAAQRAIDAGIQVIMDRCIYKDYLRLMANNIT